MDWNIRKTDRFHNYYAHQLANNQKPKTIGIPDDGSDKQLEAIEKEWWNIGEGTKTELKDDEMGILGMPRLLECGYRQADTMVESDG